MRLATIDPLSHKVQTKIYKILKFDVSRAKSKQDTAIWKFQNLQRHVWPSDASIAHCVRMPCIYTAPLADILRFHDMQFHFYADDTQLYTSFSVNDDLELIIRSW